MEELRLRLIEIANAMANGKTEYLQHLRKEVVDLDLTAGASNADVSLFAALYLSKRLTADVWENLATDASFEFDEGKLLPFTVGLGRLLREILDENPQDQVIVNRLGETAKWLYEYFAKISETPELVFRGGRNEHT